MAAVDDPPLSQKRGRTRSPAYPYIALPNALEKAAVLWQVEGRHAAAVNVAMQHWGYKEDSSTGYSCVAALKKFGLVDHEGMGDTRQVKLSGLALTILLDKDPDSDERREALRTAALGPRIHTELWERYGTELPSDQSLKRYLVQERGFNEAAVDELLDEYKQTMTFAGLNVGTGSAAPGLAVAVAGNLEEGRSGSGGTLPVTLAPAAESRGPGAQRSGGGGGAVGNPPSRTGGAPGGGAIQSANLPRTRETATNAFAAPPRPAGGREESRGPSGSPRGLQSPSRGREPGEAGRSQTDLFGETSERGEAFQAEKASAPLPARQEPAAREPAPWSMARKELPVPLDNDLVARVPYPMSEEDFELLIGTLQLWKRRLVQPDL